MLVRLQLGGSQLLLDRNDVEPHSRIGLCAFPPGMTSPVDSEVSAWYASLVKDHGCVLCVFQTGYLSARIHWHFFGWSMRGSPYLGILRYLQKRKQAMPRSQGLEDCRWPAMFDVSKSLKRPWQEGRGISSRLLYAGLHGQLPSWPSQRSDDAENVR